MWYRVNLFRDEASWNQSFLVADKLSVNLGLDLRINIECTHPSIQVTQSRRGYMQESSGSASVMLFKADSHLWSLSNLALHSGLQTSIMNSLGSWPFSNMDLMVLVASAIINKYYNISIQNKTSSISDDPKIHFYLNKKNYLEKRKRKYLVLKMKIRVIIVIKYLNLLLFSRK